MILLHEYPGNDGDVLNLGQRLADYSINALTFNYSGTWRSEELYGPATSLTNIQAAIVYVKSKHCLNTFNIDTTNISLVGYSYGGGMALLGSLHNENVKKAISIEGGDLRVVADMSEESPEFRKFHQQFLD